MIIVRLQGGLGNQLFAYACGRALALRRGAELALDLSHYTENSQRHYELDAFAIHARIATPREIEKFIGGNRFTKKMRRLFSTHVVHEPHFAFYPPTLEAPDPSYLDGYWQSEKYFEDAETTLRSELVLARPFSEAAHALETQMDDTSVSIHIRRGDYAGSQFALCSLEYYRTAITRLTERIPSPHFFIFSDDVAWMKEHLGLPDSTIVSGRGISDTEELMLMSQCRHHIIANSSYSWWGAWLNPRADKIVIAPKQWFVLSVHNTSDLLPPSWLTI